MLIKAMEIVWTFTTGTIDIDNVISIVSKI